MPQSKKFGFRLGLAAVSSWAILLLTGCGDTAKSTPAAGGEIKGKPALTVKQILPTESDWGASIQTSGTISAWQETVVGSEIGGLRLAQVMVNVGDKVRKGQLLAAMSDESVEADLAQSRASLREAQAAFAEAQANGDRARKFQGTGAISQQQITQYLTAEQTAKARIDVARARLQADELRLKQTRILAPDDGVVSARAATVGTVPQIGQELFRLILRGRLEWRAEVPAAEIGRVRIGAAAAMILASGASLSGTVRAVAPAVDAQTRNGLVYIDLKPGEGAAEAKAGMFARGEVEVGNGRSQRRTLALPQSAVLLRDGFAFVFKVGADHKLTQAKVSIGRRVGERVEILSGLTVQDQVVESGVGFLGDGDLVELAPGGATAGASMAPPFTPALTPAKS